MKRTLFFLSIVVMVSACSKKVNPAATRTATYREKVVSTSTMSADIINNVNAYRQRKGLAPMHLLSLATSLALTHSQNMAARKVSFGHAGFNQRAIAIANQLHGTSSTGENIAYGKMTAKQVLDAWLESPVHRANIEGPFNYTGVGVAKNNQGVVYYTQIFVKK